MDTLPDILKASSQMSGKTIVIKYGGSALLDIDRNRHLFEEIALLHSLGAKVLLVHGGGPQITQMLSQLRIESKHIDGLRVTDKATVDIAEMVLCGNVGKLIVANLQRLGVNTLGLSGKDLNLFSVKASTAHPDLGYFGEVDTVNTAQVDFLLSQGLIPVIAPIGLDASGSTFMLDADHLASRFAASISADKLFILTNVPGVLKEKDNAETVIQGLSADEAQDLLNNGGVGGGMIPKLQSCMEAVQSGVGNAHIFDGQTAHALLINSCGPTPVGTVLYQSHACGLRDQTHINVPDFELKPHEYQTI